MAITNKKNHHFSVEQKLEILAFAEKFGNISKACTEYKVDRGAFYIWKKQYETDGISGLNRKKQSASSHPFKISTAIEKQVLDFSLTHPEWGCSRIAPALKDAGITISSPTVQRILLDADLGTTSQRLFRLEEKYIKEKLEITNKQIELIKKNNPCVKEVNKIGSYPGEILVQDSFPIFDIFPNTYIHVVIDTFTSYAFAYPWAEKSAELAIDLLQVKAFKIFKNPKMIVTDRGYEFTQFNKSYSKFLQSKGIHHELYSGKEKNWNGFIERYKSTFFKRYRHIPLSNQNAMFTNEILQKMKNDRLNAERIVNGFPNFGVSPYKLYKSSIR